MAKRRFTDDTNGARSQHQRKDTGQAIPYGEMRFVRLELSEQEISTFKEYMAAGELSGSAVEEYLKAGYGGTLGKDKNGGGVLFCLRAATTGLPDAGLILTGRGATAITALLVCDYKLQYLVNENGWLEAEVRRGGNVSDVG